ncbi:hypothetical protein [Paenibacillus odorifer]|nr:hypothetical protein [Paenibacillus odorifer]
MKSIKAQTAMAKHLIVISYDAFSEDHCALASRLPNLAELIKKEPIAIN